MSVDTVSPNHLIVDPNGADLLSGLSRLLAQVHDDGHRPALLVIDVDHLPAINHLHGFAAGDQVLATIETRVLFETRSADKLVRVSGHRYVLVLPAVCSTDNVAVVADKLSYVIGHPIGVDGQSLHVTASFGMAVAQSSDTALDLLHRAESELDSR